MSEAYTQDFLQEDEDTCDVCNNAKKHDALKEYDGALVCKDCEEKGWAEE